MFMETVEKAGINGIVTAAASVGLFGTRATVVPPFMNNTMPLYAYLFLGGVASSLVTDGFHLFMKEEIPISKKGNDRTSVLAGLAINAIVFAGLLEIAESSIAADFGRMTALGVGAASEWLSASGYTYLKEKMYI